MVATGAFCRNGEGSTGRSLATGLSNQRGTVMTVNGTNQNLSVSGEFPVSSNAAFGDGTENAAVNIGTGELLLTSAESVVDQPLNLMVNGTEQFCCVSLSSPVCDPVGSASISGTGRLFNNGSGEHPFSIHPGHRNYWDSPRNFVVDGLGNSEDRGAGDSVPADFSIAAERDARPRVVSDYSGSFGWSVASMSDGGRWSGRMRPLMESGAGADIWDELLLLSSTATAKDIRVADMAGNGARYTGLRAQTHGGSIAYDNSADSAGGIYETLLLTSADGSAATLDWSSGAMGSGSLERCG